MTTAAPGFHFCEGIMEQIEVDEQLAEYLRELGYECSGWVVKGGRTITFFPNSRQLRNDIRRFRRTSGESISSTDVAPVEDFTSSDSYAPALESCAKIRGLCEDIASKLKAGHTLAPNSGTR